MARYGTPRLILDRIQSNGRGWVFSPRDFLDLGNRACVDQALKRMSIDRMHRDPQTQGHLELRRIGWGLYDYPRWDLDGTGPPPNLVALARAISRRDGHRITQSGAHHAHDLGLTVFSGSLHRRIYLTDGPDRVYDTGAGVLEFRHAGPRTMAWAGRSGGPIVLALAWLGPQLTETAKTHLRSRGIGRAAVEDLQRNLWMAPSYLQPALRELVGARRKRRRRKGSGGKTTPRDDRTAPYQDKTPQADRDKSG